MSLRKGLRSLPSDRETEISIKELFNALRRHEGEWLSAERICRISGVMPLMVDRILPALVEAAVLGSRDEPAVYRFAPDRLLSLEVESFLRRAETRTGKFQDDVARFRERYGTR